MQLCRFLTLISILITASACVSSQSAITSFQEVPDLASSNEAPASYLAFTIDQLNIKGVFTAALEMTVVEVGQQKSSVLRYDIEIDGADESVRLQPVLFPMPPATYKISEARLAIKPRYFRGRTFEGSHAELEFPKNLKQVSLVAGEVLHVAQIDLLFESEGNGPNAMRYAYGARAIQDEPKSAPWMRFEKLSSRFAMRYVDDRNDSKPWSLEAR